jgi:hypothetical protein
MEEEEGGGVGGRGVVVVVVVVVKWEVCERSTFLTKGTVGV